MASPLIVSNKETFCGYSLVANCILSLHFYDLHFQSVVRIGISHLVVFCLWSSLKNMEMSQGQNQIELIAIIGGVSGL